MSHVLLDTHKHQAVITLNRAELHNAFDDTLIAELSDALDQIANNKQVRYVILRANGKHFCAGADMNWMQRMASFSDEENYQDAYQLSMLLHKLNEFPRPVIALAHGAVYGGGLGLIACCDVVVATKNARFCFSEVKLGMIPATISPFVLQAIGARQARRYFLTAETFTADTAKQLGLVHEVVANNALDSHLEELDKTLLQASPVAQTQCKQLIHTVSQQPISEQLLQDTAKQLANVRGSAEAKTGLSAFLNKQKPDWCNDV